MESAMEVSTGDLNRAIGRIEGKIDAFIKQMETHDIRTTDIETRLRAVENKQWWMAGVGSIIGMLLGALGLHVKW